MSSFWNNLVHSSIHLSSGGKCAINLFKIIVCFQFDTKRRLRATYLVPFNVNIQSIQLDEMEGEIHKMQEVLEPSRQSMWALLRSSICQRLDFWLTMVYPSQMEKCAERMDNLIINAIQKLLGSQIPLKEEGQNWNCPVQVLALKT